MAKLALRFILGAEKKGMNETAGFLRGFSDFMQEMKQRELDMRETQAKF